MTLPNLTIIRPIAVSAASLTATNVPETPPAAWSSGTTYALDAQATDLTNHLVYQSVAGSNLNHPLTDIAWWVLVGPDNRWAMFDQSNTTQTVHADSVAVTVQTSGRVDSVALFNLEAASVRILSKDGATTIYDQTYTLASTAGVDDWYSYFFEPVERRTDLVVSDLPIFANQTISVTISDAGNTVKVGNLVIGLSRDLGMPLEDGETGIIDYSKKVIDDFGNASIREGAFSKKMSLKVVVENDRVDQVQNLLTRYRAAAIVWSGIPGFAVGDVFGFFRSFGIAFSYHDHSICTLDIEGLT